MSVIQVAIGALGKMMTVPRYLKISSLTNFCHFNLLHLGTPTLVNCVRPRSWMSPGRLTTVVLMVPLWPGLFFTLSLFYKYHSDHGCIDGSHCDNLLFIHSDVSVLAHLFTSPPYIKYSALFYCIKCMGRVPKKGGKVWSLAIPGGILLFLILKRLYLSGFQTLGKAFLRHLLLCYLTSSRSQTLGK